MKDMITRDLDKHPFSAEEERIAEYLYECGYGGDEDPIYFPLALYEKVMALDMRRKPLRE